MQPARGSVSQPQPCPIKRKLIDIHFLGTILTESAMEACGLWAAEKERNRNPVSTYLRYVALWPRAQGIATKTGEVLPCATG